MCIGFALEVDETRLRFRAKCYTVALLGVGSWLSRWRTLATGTRVWCAVGLSPCCWLLAASRKVALQGSCLTILYTSRQQSQAVREQHMQASLDIGGQCLTSSASSFLS
jgi:hypothetical protein